MTILLLILILLASTTLVYMFWMMFIFNAQFGIHGGVENVKKFIEVQGSTHLTVLLILGVLLLVLFTIYALKDNKRLIMYNDGYDISFHTHDNLLSKWRIGQFIFLILLVINFVTRIYRVNILDPTAPYNLIFQQDLMMFGFEFMAVYSIAFVGTLIFEYFKNRDITYQ